MIIINVKELTLRLAEILIPAGFYKKGNAFFRMHGDGVLQTLKWEYDIRDKVHYLQFGLRSLYGELEPRILTPSWCIPQFFAMHLVDKNYFYTPLGWGDLKIAGTAETLHVGGVGFWRRGPGYQEAYERAEEIHLQKISFETQLKEVERVVLPYLDLTATQDKMLETMFHYEKSRMQDEAIFPLLFCGRYQEALEIVRWYRDINYQDTSEAGGNQQAKINAVTLFYYEQFLRWEETILRGEDAVHAWLQENYLKNQAMFEEMIPPKRRGKKKVSEK